VRDERGLHKVREYYPERDDGLPLQTRSRSVAGSDAGPAGGRGVPVAEVIRRFGGARGVGACVLGVCRDVGCGDGREVKAAVRQAPGHFGPCQRQAGVILPVKVAYRCSCLMTRAWHA